MTREEALNKAINIVSYFEAHFAKSKEAREEAINIIETLEQEPILDKVRAEIEEKAERYCLSRENISMGQVEWSERLIKESDVLQIIDKYRREG